MRIALSQPWISWRLLTFRVLAFRVLGLSAMTGTVWADEGLRRTDDLDGMYLTVGPVLSATHVDAGWSTGAGGELSVVWLREGCTPALVGLAAGGVFYGDSDEGRLWAEIETAFQRGTPVPVGLAAGVTTELDELDPPRFGVHGTLFFFTGVVPYIRAGAVELSGRFVELGVAVKLPAWRW